MYTNWKIKLENSFNLFKHAAEDEFVEDGLVGLDAEFAAESFVSDEFVFNCFIRLNRW